MKKFIVKAAYEKGSISLIEPEHVWENTVSWGCELYPRSSPITKHPCSWSLITPTDSR